MSLPFALLALLESPPRPSHSLHPRRPHNPRPPQSRAPPHNPRPPTTPTAQPAHCTTAAASPRRYSWTSPRNPGAEVPRCGPKVTWVETGRRTVGGLTALDFSLFQGGKAPSDSDLEELGILSTPSFLRHTMDAALRARLYPVFRRRTPQRAGGTGASLGLGHHLPQPRPGASPAKSSPTRRSTTASASASGPASARGYMHPSPDTGDFFESETCFAPNVGITLRSFSSVWGDFTLRLLTPPSAPPLP